MTPGANRWAAGRRIRADWVVPAVLVCCTGISTLSTDLYVPSMPHLPEMLGTDASTVQLTISLNLAAYCIAQLVHGPVADAIGRRRLLLVAFSGFVAASIACALVASIGALIAGRIVQGVFSSVPSVVVLLIIRELFEEHRAVRVLGFYGMAVGIAGGLGPLVGGYLYIWAGWRASFWTMAALAALVGAAVFLWIPETRQRSTRLNLRSTLSTYWQLLRTQQYLRYLIPLCAVYGAFYAFVTNGPFLLIDRLGVPTQRYGLYYALLVTAFVFGSFVASRMAGKMRTERLVDVAVGLAVLGALVLALPILHGVERLGGIVTGMVIVAAALGLLFASASVRLMDSAGTAERGPASALLGSLQLGSASVAGLIVGEFYDGTPLPLAATVAGFAAVSVIGYMALWRRAAP
jgi:DHA1 family bicyclomycin/chloramphenicol resistance-like MFS transporter